MHEMGIAIEIYRTCRDTVAEHGGGRLRQVRIAVGELAAVEPDLLVFGWEAVVADTPDQGAALTVDFCRADQRCPACNQAKDRSEGSWLRICPDCGTPLEVRGGDELDVIEVSFETDEEGCP
ncbi:MAG: hydrogenase maturation nickel metallochaperone HypA [Thermoanaerobaculales bacterium]|jgi:hydrogenase nickel incorporation protein HypA/HybF|nr:hydrogenase maturation nickel metallochaperone HypA [Thermoanaerobaculales bacterium]